MEMKNIEKKQVRRTEVHELELGENRDKEKGRIPYVHLFLMGFVILLLFAGVNVVSAAAPSITDWSSTGGNTTNKDNDQDIMYLVKQGDTITFNVTVTGSEPITYEWQVNKVVDKSATTNTFIWTVPNEKGIWEIHLKVSNTDGEDHKEWVVSTLSIDEAPDFFDYFTDKKYNNRTENDPWGRALPEWSIVSGSGNIDTKKGFIYAADSPQNLIRLSTQSDVVYGTWRFWMRCPCGPRTPSTGGTWGHLYFAMKSSETYYWYGFATDGHTWLGYIRNNIIPYRKSFAYRDVVNPGTAELDFTTDWHRYTVIREPDGRVYMWRDDKFVWGSLDKETEMDESTSVMLEFARTGAEANWWVEYDNMEFYKNKSLYPNEKNAIYGEYEDHTAPGPVIVNATGIEIDGRNVTLGEIDSMINNPSVFTYDETTRTAKLYTTLSIKGGAELVIENEKLIIHSDYPGENGIRIKNGGTVRIVNSTIDSDTNGYFYKWRFTSLNVHADSELALGNVINTKFKGVFIAKNSVINNSGGMYLVGVNTLIWDNVSFTNLNSVDETAGKVAILFKNRLTTANYTIRNCKFTGKIGTETVWFSGGDPFGEANIYNTRFENIDVKAESDNWYERAEPSKRTVNLINSQFEDLTLGDGLAYILPKYYLDVQVVDANGNPISGANVTVTNEIDDINYPSENLLEAQGWVNTINEGWSGQQNTYLKWIDVNDMHSTFTGSDGHTPLPSEEPAKTLIITDYKKYLNLATNKTEVENFTYTITASYNGKTASLSGLDIDESWYREDPNTPIKTVVCNIDTGNCWIEGVATGTLTGKVTDKDTGLPIVGATVTANSHQTTTNSTGGYTITLPAGNYTLTASKTGYYPNSTTVEVLVNQTTTLNFQLLTEDTTPPVISSVNATSITPTTAVITWETDEKATSLLKYGTESGSYPYSKEDTSYTTSHSITLTDLQPNTTYYFLVDSTDKAGNPAQSTEYSFNTPTLPTTKGDINGDGKVNSLDYSLLVAKWFKTTDITQEDLNKDGIVNVRDLGILMSNWKE